MSDCPDVIKNIKDAIDSLEEAYVSSQVDALSNISDDLKTVNNIPGDVPASQKKDIICATMGAAFDAFNNMRNSCNFDPSGCLKQVLDSGVLDGNPIAAGAALAAAVFVDAATGNFTPPVNVPPPAVTVGVIQPSLPGKLNIPDFPSPPPSDECQDPVADLAAALQQAEDTYADLHQQAANGLANSIDEFTNGLGGIPQDIQLSVLCLAASTGFDAAADLSLGTCTINIGDCLKQVLESGILGGNPIAAGAALGASIFADGAAGALPSIGPQV